jgi:hypothetical protein
VECGGMCRKSDDTTSAVSSFKPFAKTTSIMNVDHNPAKNTYILSLHLHKEDMRASFKSFAKFNLTGMWSAGMSNDAYILSINLHKKTCACTLHSSSLHN